MNTHYLRDHNTTPPYHVRTFIYLFAVIICLLSGTPALAQQTSCTPHIIDIAVKKSHTHPFASPQLHTTQPTTAPITHSPFPSAELLNPAGWQSAALPDNWDKRWPGYTGGAWYRIRWNNCGHIATQGLFIDHISMAGAVFVNQDLIWRDIHLTPPLSRSWNAPRMWTLPPSVLNPTENTLWVYVQGVSTQSPGVGKVHIDTPANIQDKFSKRHWQKRDLFLINMVLSAAFGFVFFIIWCLYPTYKAALWFSASMLFWCLYVSTILCRETHPLSNSLMFAKVNLSFLVVNILFFCVCCWRLADKAFFVITKALFALTGSLLALLWLCPDAWLPKVLFVVYITYVAIFLLNSITFQFLAWRRGSSVAIKLIAFCLLCYIVFSFHDVWLMVAINEHHFYLTPYSIIITTLVFTLIMGLRYRDNIQRIAMFSQTIKGFNAELNNTLQSSRAELKNTLEKQHKIELENTHLQTRIQLSHDLHDGLGGSLVRAIASLEARNDPIDNQQFVSILKMLRNDLRQVVDTGSSLGASAPDTPILWLAPVRHRFTLLFEELDISADWHVPDTWETKPSTLKCLTLLRIVEEALTNVIKHSHATQVTLVLSYTALHEIKLSIKDNGVGFNVAAVNNAGLSVGMQSMKVRLARVGGQLDIVSTSGETRIEVIMQV